MIKSILNSLGKMPINGIFLFISLALYLLNNIFMKDHSSGFVHELLICHFNDFMGGIFVLSYSNLFFVIKDKAFVTLKAVLIYSLLVGIFWEVGGALIRPTAVFDVLDILSYMLGGCVYWVFLKVFDSYVL